MCNSVQDTIRIYILGLMHILQEESPPVLSPRVSSERVTPTAATAAAAAAAAAAAVGVFDMGPLSGESPVFPSGGAGGMGSPGFASYDLGGGASLTGAPLSEAPLGAPAMVSGALYKCDFTPLAPLSSKRPGIGVPSGVPWGPPLHLSATCRSPLTGWEGGAHSRPRRGSPSPFGGPPAGRLPVAAVPPSGGPPVWGSPCECPCPSPPRLRPKSPPDLLLEEAAGEIDLLPELREWDDAGEGTYGIYLMGGPLNEPAGSQGPPPIRGLSQQLTEALASWGA